MDKQILYAPATCRSYAIIAMVQQQAPPVQQPALTSVRATPFSLSFRQFCQSISGKASDMGLRWPKWPDVVKYGRTTEDIPFLFREIVQEYKQSGTTCDLIFVVLNGKNSEHYSKSPSSLLS